MEENEMLLEVEEIEYIEKIADRIEFEIPTISGNFTSSVN
jgi:hypothetical protein